MSRICRSVRCGTVRGGAVVVPGMMLQELNPLEILGVMMGA